MVNKIEKNNNSAETSATKKLDRLDCKLIGLLQTDGRMPNNAIARQLGISEYTARRRLKRLINSGIIRIVAVANPIDLGFAIAGNLKIHIDLKKTERVLDNLKKIDKQISKIDGIVSTETSLLVDIVKDKYEWGTGWD